MAVLQDRVRMHEQLARVHDEYYLTRVSNTAGRAVAFDADTYTFEALQLFGERGRSARRRESRSGNDRQGKRGTYVE